MIRALWTLSRPAMVPYVLTLVGSGYGWAHWDRALPLQRPLAFASLLAAWSLLHAGTLWLNAAVDRDEGEVLFGRAVRPPPGTEAAGYAALALGLPFASIDPLAAMAYAACAVLAVLYSHPATFLKGHPVGGPFVNIAGYGMLSPLAGWALVDVAVNPRTLVMWPVCALGIFGVYLTAQAFQQREDRERGYRTLVATRGPRVVLRLARASLALAIGIGVGLAVIGWIPRIAALCALGWWPVDRHLAAWARLEDGGTELHARVFARHMARLIALGVLLVFVQYALDSARGGPVAGLATPSGRPPEWEAALAGAVTR